MTNQAEPKHVVALSGGKDSTALAVRLKELHPERGFEFVYTPTGDELPPMEAHWKILHGLLGKVTALTVMSLEELIYEQKMIPNYRARFCTRVLKIEPFLRYMSELPEGSVMYVGLRADEEDRVGALLPKESKYRIETPMREWGWGIQQVKEYLACKGIVIPQRTDCGACFFQRIPEWHALLQEYPERYARYEKIEEDIGFTFRSPHRDTWPASLKEMRLEFERGRKIRTSKREPVFAACPWCSK